MSVPLLVGRLPLFEMPFVDGWGQFGRRGGAVQRLEDRHWVSELSQEGIDVVDAAEVIPPDPMEIACCGSFGSDFSLDRFLHKLMISKEFICGCSGNFSHHINHRGDLAVTVAHKMDTTHAHAQSVASANGVWLL